ncbi:type II toxin-antitoxin system VapC family toxin [soil metagenome]
MQLLLDTNALLWLLDGDDRIGASTRAAVEGADALTVSVVSLWEIAIKVSIGKLAPIPGLHATIASLGFQRLPIADAHLVALEGLPHVHRDPFDRLLVGQALVERLTVLTTDRVLAQYSIPVLDARS